MNQYFNSQWLLMKPPLSIAPQSNSFRTNDYENIHDGAHLVKILRQFSRGFTARKIPSIF